jgi:biotin synthase
LIENYNLPPDAFDFDEHGNIAQLDAPDIIVDAAIDTGLPFMTNGCPDRNGVMACNRPYGSYRPGEEFRDYPFLPDANDLVVIRKQMRLDEVWAKIS